MTSTLLLMCVSVTLHLRLVTEEHEVKEVLWRFKIALIRKAVALEVLALVEPSTTATSASVRFFLLKRINATYLIVHSPLGLVR